MIIFDRLQLLLLDTTLRHQIEYKFEDQLMDNNDSCCTNSISQQDQKFNFHY